jgi:hypothetical protein
MSSDTGEPGPDQNDDEAVGSFDPTTVRGQAAGLGARFGVRDDLRGDQADESGNEQ